MLCITYIEHFLTNYITSILLLYQTLCRQLEETGELRACNYSVELRSQVITVITTGFFAMGKVSR